jgi:hypothetical protein
VALVLPAADEVVESPMKKLLATLAISTALIMPALAAQPPMPNSCNMVASKIQGLSLKYNLAIAAAPDTATAIWNTELVPFWSGVANGTQCNSYPDWVARMNAMKDKAVAARNAFAVKNDTSNCQAGWVKFFSENGIVECVPPGFATPGPIPPDNHSTITGTGN